jgi:putative heme-binding domain-containing protein
MTTKIFFMFLTTNSSSQKPLVLLLAAIGLLIGQSASAQETGDHQYTTEAIEAGSRVYTQQCALCHGPQGDTVDGINLRRGQFRNVRSDDDLRQVITSGAAEGRMPAFDLRQDELDGVIAYIRAGFDPEGVAVKIGDPANGEVLFRGKGGCADCHRIGNSGPRTAPDLTDIGAIRTPSALQRSLVEPATALLPINRAVRIITRDEEVVTGRRVNEDTYTVQLIDSQQRLRSLVKADLVRYELSATPTHEPTTLSSDEVADLVGYLLTLRGLQ